VLIGMWLERFIIVVPTLVNPRLPYERGAYAPTWVELSLTVACFAMFTLLFVLFTRFFPIISIWEIQEGRQRAIPDTVEQLLKYAPSRGPRPTLTLPAVLLLLAALASPARAGGTPADDPRTGMDLFVQKGCLRCHAILGEGGRAGPDLARAVAGRTFLDTAAGFWNHSPGMMRSMGALDIPRPRLTSGETDALFRFLQALNRFDPPGDYSRGEAVARRHSCLTCHRVGGRGGRVGPTLDRMGRLSPVEVAQAMWNHLPRMQGAMSLRGIEAPRFTGTELGDLVAFLRGEAASAGMPTYGAPGDPSAGRSRFRDKGCTACHTGPDLGPRLRAGDGPFSVTAMSSRMWNHGATLLRASRVRGLPMPTFRGDEMADLLAYLHTLRFQDPPGDPARGALAFRRKGCAGCHVSGPGPDLTNSPALSSPPAMVSALWNHAASTREQSDVAPLPWPRLDGAVLRDLLAWLKAKGKRR